MPGKAPRETSKKFTLSQRVRKAAEFDRVFESGQVTRGRWFNMRVLRDPAAFPSRLGLVISSKAAPKAVSRNRWKRILRETFRCGAFRIAGGAMIVVQARQMGKLPGRNEAEDEFWDHLKKHNLLNQ
ncbi:MAG: ribonuclease P protein component [Candidatus Omnitrophica bacterium]|nr:ribonuclease P protein component [Candidatus Omnitrophota bacterium]